MGRSASLDGKKQSRLDKGPSCLAALAKTWLTPARGVSKRITLLLLPVLASLFSVLASERRLPDRLQPNLHTSSSPHPLTPSSATPARPDSLQAHPSFGKPLKRVWWSKDAVLFLPRPRWCHLDQGAQPFMTRLRGNPREKSALLPDLLGQILGKSGNAQGCAQRGLRVFRDSTRGQGVASLVV